MKKQTKFKEDRTEMLPEYDFSQMGKGVQGKYYKAYRAGHTVRIIKEEDDIGIHCKSAEKFDNEL